MQRRADRRAGRGARHLRAPAATLYARAARRRAAARRFRRHGRAAAHQRDARDAAAGAADAGAVRARSARSPMAGPASWFGAAQAARARRRGRLLRARSRARRSVSSAKAARANRRPERRCSASIPFAGEVVIDGMRDRAASARGDEAGAPQGADDLPGSLCLARPAHVGRRRDRRAAAIHGIGTRRERRDRVAELLRRVGLSPDHATPLPA